MKSISFWNEPTIQQEPGLSPHYINHLPRYQTNNLESLRQYLKTIGPLPKGSSFLGTCHDGLPLLIDFRDSTPGSMLLISEDKYSSVNLLRSILASAMMLNSDRNLRCSAISPNIGNFSDLTTSEHFTNLLSSYETKAHEHIINLSVLAEQRRTGRHIGATHLLMIDEISEILKYDDFETSNHLGWLIENGPKNSVWTIASIERNLVDQSDKKILRSFGTIILGNRVVGNTHLLKSGQSQYLDGYTTRIGTESINFHLPMHV